MLIKAILFTIIKTRYVKLFGTFLSGFGGFDNRQSVVCFLIVILHENSEQEMSETLALKNVSLADRSNKNRTIKYLHVQLNNRTTCDLPFVTLWHSESSSAVTLLLHTDWMMLKDASNQRGANSVTFTTLGSLKAAFLENYLVTSTWILNASSIKINTTRRNINLWVNLVFSLDAVRFKFLGENLYKGF